jgi:hypothetical protein
MNWVVESGAFDIMVGLSSIESAGVAVQVAAGGTNA